MEKKKTTNANKNVNKNANKNANKNVNKKVKKIIITILSILLISVISFLVIHTINANKNKKLYADLLQQEIIPDKATEELSQVNKEFVEKVKELEQENADIKGWIRIEDTSINYPLLQTDNNDYYLIHNYKKEKSSYGSIFINNNCNIKNENSNVIIYGHNMKDGQMFTDLLQYKDKSFYEQHPIIKIATDESEEDYEIIYTFKSRVFYQDEKNVFRFYRYYDFENEDQYNEYINNCKKIQLYDTEKTATYGEQLITLITCEYSQENGRMVVVAKKVK